MVYNLEDMNKVVINKYIIADPEICHGKPTFKGTRVMVWQVLAMLRDGETNKEIVAAFPRITSEHIQAALDYASSLTSEAYVVLNTQPQISS